MQRLPENRVEDDAEQACAMQQALDQDGLQGALLNDSHSFATIGNAADRPQPGLRRARETCSTLP